MVGSRDSIAAPNVVLNTITADAFCEACDVLEQAEDFHLAVHDLIKQYACEHYRIVFNGNGYSQEWVEEAERRGLPNIASMVEAIPYLTADDTVALFEKFKVFTRAELESRQEIQFENYAKAINIEARAMIDIASKQILPVTIKYATQLANSINEVKNACAFADTSVQEEMLMELSELLKDLRNALHHLDEVTAVAATKASGREQAEYFYAEVFPAMGELRKPADRLEMIVAKDMWPMPSYGDLLFEV